MESQFSDLQPNFNGIWRTQVEKKKRNRQRLDDYWISCNPVVGTHRNGFSGKPQTVYPLNNRSFPVSYLNPANVSMARSRIKIERKSVHNNATSSSSVVGGGGNNDPADRSSAPLKRPVQFRR